MTDRHLPNSPLHPAMVDHPAPTASGVHGRPRIDLFCEDAATAEAAAKAGGHRRMNGTLLRSRMGGVHAACNAYTTMPSPDLLIVETLLDANGILAEMDRLANVCDEGTRVIVIGHVNDVLLYRELLRRHISDYLVAPVAPDQLADAMAAALRGDAAETLGRVIVFLSAKGGCGSSTICHNTAWVLAEEMKTETLIADFDLAFGTLGLDFNQDGGSGLSEALAASHKLDGEMLTSLASKCSEHLSLLTAPYTLGDENIGKENALRLVELMSQTVPFAVLDLPSEWRDWSAALVEQADDVVITAEPDLANLRNAKNLIDTARALRATARPPVLVMNKMGLPRRPEIGLRDFANAVDLQPSTVIGFDAQLFGTAANNGLMIGEAMPKARQIERFRKLAEMLGGKLPAAPAQQSLIGRLSRRLAG